MYVNSAQLQSINRHRERNPSATIEISGYRSDGSIGYIWIWNFCPDEFCMGSMDKNGEIYGDGQGPFKIADFPHLFK